VDSSRIIIPPVDIMQWSVDDGELYKVKEDAFSAVPMGFILPTLRFENLATRQTQWCELALSNGS